MLKILGLKQFKKSVLKISVNNTKKICVKKLMLK